MIIADLYVGVNTVKLFIKCMEYDVVMVENNISTIIFIPAPRMTPVSSLKH
jgi:hypothetical protein